jgi:NADH-quinone oxidoreductase subunit H
VNALDVIVAVVAVGAVSVAGIYLAAWVDLLVGRAVAGLDVRPLDALIAPLRAGAATALKARSTTERPDAETWALAPALLAALAAVGLAAVPLAPGLLAADVANGIVLFGAAMALVVVAVFLQGWSPNSPLPMIGGYRFIAEGLSYEIPLAVVLIAAALPARSLAIAPIITSQEHLWNVVRQPLGLPLYLMAGLGLAFWGPLALPEGQDLAGGSSLETSGVSRILWRASQLLVLVAVAAMGAAVFLGGWLGPLLPGAAWMILKTLFLLVLLIATRHFVARVPTERYVIVSWAILIPLSLLDVFAAGIQALVAAK